MELNLKEMIILQENTLKGWKIEIKYKEGRYGCEDTVYWIISKRVSFWKLWYIYVSRYLLNKDPPKNG